MEGWRREDGVAVGAHDSEPGVTPACSDQGLEHLRSVVDLELSLVEGFASAGQAGRLPYFAAAPAGNGTCPVRER